MRLLWSFIIIFFFAINLLMAQDECITATPILVGAAPLMEDNSSATTDNNYVASLGACIVPDYEASNWYSFVANTNVMEIIFTQNSIVDPIMVIVDNCTPGNEIFSYFSCNPDGVHAFCNMIPGNQYFILISSEFANTGTYVLDVNYYNMADDDCVDDGTEQQLTGIGSLPNNYCSSDGTVWYTIPANNFSQITVTLMGSNWTLADPEIYSAWLNGCPNNGGINVTADIPDWLCLGSGDVLYLEVGDDDPEFGGFGYGVTWSPGNNGNDNCPDASLLVDVECDNSVGGNAVTSDCITIDGDAVCNPGEAGVWYSFGVSDVVSFFDVTGGDFDLFSGTCSDLTFVGCSGSAEVMNIMNVGLTYYVLLYEGGGFAATSTIPAPANDNCTSADESLTPNGIVSGNNVCATPDHNLCGGGFTDNDFQTVWFEYPVENNGTSIDITVTGGGPNPIDDNELSIAVYEICNLNLAEEYDELNGTGYVCNTNQMSLTCLPIGTYYIAVGTSFDGGGDFDIQVMEEVEAPPNDLCSDPEDAIDADFLTNSCAGQEVQFCSLNGSEAHDVWYQYTLVDVPSDLTILIEDDNSNGNAVEEVNVAVFLDCNQTPIDMANPDYGIACNTLDEIIELSCVTATEIYLVVSSAHGDEGDFEITIEESPGSITYEIEDEISLLCADQMTELNAGPGYDEYSWIGPDGIEISTDQIVQVDEQGLYEIIVSVNGCTGADMVNVDLIEPPVVNIPSAFLVCNSEGASSPAIIDFNMFSNSSDDGNWTSLDLDNSILDNITNVSFVGVPAGEYDFVYTTVTAIVPCEELSDTLTIIVSDCDCPDPILLQELEFCNNLLMYNMNELLSMFPIEGSWIFIDGPEQIVISNDSIISTVDLSNGTYEFAYDITEIVPDDCPQSDTIEIIIYEPIEVSFAEIPDMCNQLSSIGPNVLNLNSVLLSGSGMWVDPLIPGLDFSDLNSLDFTGVTAGSYAISFVSDNSGNPCPDEFITLDIEVSDCECPVLEIISSDELCNTTNDYSLNDLIIMADPGTWSTGSGIVITNGLVDFTDVFPGSYAFIYTLDNPIADCPSQVFVTIELFNQPAVSSIDSVMCNIEFDGELPEMNLDELVSGDAGDWFDSNGDLILDWMNFDFSPYSIGDIIEFTFVTNTAIDPCENASAATMVEIVDCSCDIPAFSLAMELCNTNGQEVNLEDLLISGPSGTWSLATQPTNGTATLDGTIFSSEAQLEGIYTFEYTLDDDSNPNCQAVWPIDISVVSQLTSILQTSTDLCDTVSVEYPLSIILDELILSGSTAGIWFDRFNDQVPGNTVIEGALLTEGSYTFTYVLDQDAPCNSNVYESVITVHDCSEEEPEEPEEPEVEIDILTPNIFSPNGDGNNDLFELLAGDFTVPEFLIFDRWGSLIYSASSSDPDLNLSWNGKMNGADVAEGVYVFYIRLLKLDDTEVVLSGDVTLIR